MADEGGYSVWAMDDDQAEQPKPERKEPDGPQNPTRSPFDDLQDANADWGVSPSSPPEAEAAAETVDAKGASATEEVPPGPSLFDEEQEQGGSMEGEVKGMADQLDSAGFDDFEDGLAGGNDDDFGDFGDFEEEGMAPVEEPIVESEAGATREWRPLQLSVGKSDASVEAEIREILAPAFPGGRMYPFHDGAASQLSQDQVRQVEGEAQVLVREESRRIWQSLTGEPDVRPVDWMRSSTRRQHLIALGVPINLDEVRVADGSGSKALPPLALKLDKKPVEEANGVAARSRNGTHEGREAKPPSLDMTRAKELMSLSEDQLTLLTLPALRDMAREMDALTRQASALLTHHLSQREAHNADAETYNGLIRDLVTGAANRFGATSNVKRSSTLRKASNGSGRNSPAPSQVSQLR